MTDRELLELAAKAAGLKVDREWQSARDLVSNPDKASLWIINGSSGWNPLKDDGDALRLAVKLYLTVDIDDEAGEAWVRKPWYADCEVTEPFGDDLFAATRRAIVLAAAAIQLSKEGK